MQVLPDSGSWRTVRASVDAWVVDPAGQEVWRCVDIRGGDPFSFAVQGPRVRQACDTASKRLADAPSHVKHTALGCEVASKECGGRICDPHCAVSFDASGVRVSAGLKSHFAARLRQAIEPSS